jgi:hypothetical protein
MALIMPGVRIDQTRFMVEDRVDDWVDPELGSAGLSTHEKKPDLATKIEIAAQLPDPPKDE